MNRSELKIIVVTAILILIFPLLSCFKCNDHWDVSSMEIRFFNDTIAVTEGEIYADSLTLRLFLEDEIVEQYNFDLGSSGALYAFDCADPDLIKSYTDIEITSTNDFNDIPAGNRLNDKLAFFSGITYSYGSINSFVDEYLQEGSFHFSGFDFRFQEKPIESTHKFTLQLEAEDGTLVKTESQEIIWK